MGKTIHTETQVHRDAFAFYWACGRSRSLSRVARRFGISKQSATHWNGSFGWQEKIRKLEALVGEEQLEIAVEQEATWRDNTLKIIDATAARYAQRLKANEVDPTPADIARLTQTRLLLTGQATARTEKTMDAKAKAELTNAFVDAANEAFYPACPACHHSLDDQPRRLGAALAKRADIFGSNTGPAETDESTTATPPTDPAPVEAEPSEQGQVKTGATEPGNELPEGGNVAAAGAAPAPPIAPEPAPAPPRVEPEIPAGGDAPQGAVIDTTQAPPPGPEGQA